MANNVNQDITGRYVRLIPESLKPEWRTPLGRLFKVDADNPGFGAKPFTMGNAVFGTFVVDGERARIDGRSVERVLTDQEAEAIIAEAAKESGG